MKAQAPTGTPTAKTEQFTSATSEQLLVFSNILWQSSNFDYNVPVDSTNPSQSWYPLRRLYYNAVWALGEWRKGSSDCLELLKTSWHFPRLQWGEALPACHVLCLIKNCEVHRVAQVYGLYRILSFKLPITSAFGGATHKKTLETQCVIFSL